MIKYLIAFVIISVQVIKGYSYQDIHGHTITITDITIVEVVDLR